MKSIGFLLISFFMTAAVFAGDNNLKMDKNNSVAEKSEAKIIVSGNIKDNKNDETLAGAAVFFDGKKIYSDLDGKFTLPVTKPGKYQLKVELISYGIYEEQIDIQEGGDVSIRLTQE